MKMTPNEELEFAYRIRRALDDGIEDIPEPALNRLNAARKLAIAHKKLESAAIVAAAAPQMTSRIFNVSFEQSRHWMRRIGVIIPLFILVLGSVGIFYYAQEHHNEALAELDSAILADELPITAYIDHGFVTYLHKHGE